MLSLLSQEQLARLVLPLGAVTKAEVRVMAADLGLEVADKPESQDVCFIDGDYRPFLQERGFVDVPGPIVDRAGHVLGEHAGLSGYTAFPVPSRITWWESAAPTMRWLWGPPTRRASAGSSWAG